MPGGILALIFSAIKEKKSLVVSDTIEGLEEIEPLIWKVISELGDEENLVDIPWHLPDWMGVVQVFSIVRKTKDKISYHLIKEKSSRILGTLKFSPFAIERRF